MNTTDTYLMEFQHESATTRSVLEAVPEAQYGWRPNEKGMSMAELCGHIATIPSVMPQVMSADSFDISVRPDPDPAPTTTAETLALHDASVAATTEWLSGLGDTANGTWHVMKGDQELMAMPRTAAIRSFLLNHLYHHRGQLSAYLRAAGEVVPSVYGPTADVDPFA
jgi:uncharacterized damage-inducible protein DinB